MMAVAILLPELFWSIDFVCRLIAGPDALPTRGTRYMFNTDISVFVRGLSLFHMALPACLIWLVYRFGYERRALVYQTLLALLVLPITYMVTEPSENINWVHGFGREPQTWMPGPLFLVMLMVLIPSGLYLPTHLLLSRLFARRPPC